MKHCIFWILTAVMLYAVPLAAEEAVPSGAAEAMAEVIPDQTQFREVLFAPLPKYLIMGQHEEVLPVGLLRAGEKNEEGHMQPEPFQITGNCVDTFYLHPDAQNHPNRIDVANHYIRAMRPYGSEILFQDEYTLYARFTRDDKEYYLALHVYSKGREYELIILERLL